MLSQTRKSERFYSLDPEIEEHLTAYALDILCKMNLNTMTNHVFYYQAQLLLRSTRTAISR